jgi:hypothetical protein
MSVSDQRAMANASRVTHAAGTTPICQEAAMLHRTFRSAPFPTRTSRAVHRATSPPANPPLDDAAVRHSVAALERVIGR